MIVKLSERGRVFMTRLLGERLRLWLEASVASWDQRTPVYVDFNSVIGFDAPSADQCFGLFLEQMRAGEREPVCLCLVNTTRDQAEHMGMVLSQRNLCLVATGRWGWALVGKIAQGIDEVVDSLHAAATPLRPRELADQVGIAGPAAGNRLRRLWLGGVLLRQEEQVPHGWEYAYGLPPRVMQRARLTGVEALYSQRP